MDNSVSTLAAKTIAVRNPRTGESDYRFEQPGAARLAAHAAELRRAQRDWHRQGAERRCRVLLEFAAALEERRAAVLERLAVDTGRRRETELELSVTVDAIRRRCGQVPALLAEREQQTDMPSIRIRRQLAPYALVGCIAPWNFPLLLSLIDAVPALLAGAAVMVKPSELTPRFVEPLRDIVSGVDGLGEVLQIVPGDGAAGADVIELADLVCFTGSVATGRKVAMAAARRFIPAHLELGGKDPAIVAADADLERAAAALCWGGLTNAGQSCLSIERVYVHADIAADFTAALAAEVDALRLNYPDIDEGEIGPIISAAQIEIIRAHLADAADKGARAVRGGAIEIHGGGSWCRPTILAAVNHEMRVMREETFGPILPVMPFQDDAEAIRLANDSDYGLSAAVFCGDAERARRIAGQLEAGAVSINDAALTAVMHEGEKQSFKASGLGGSRMGAAAVRRFLRARALLENTARGRNPWWFDRPA